MSRRVPALILFFLFALMAASFWRWPLAVPALGLAYFTTALLLTLSSIVWRYRGVQNSGWKIVRAVSIWALTLLTVIFLSGFMSYYVNAYIGVRFGAGVALVVNMGVSFLLAWVIWRGVQRLRG